MRHIKNISLLIIALSIMSSCFKANLKTSTLKVKGNCGMCKQTIEKSLKVDGIYEADWSIPSKVLTVSYDSILININTIATYVARSGYDNELVKADDKSYKSLHSCCQYKR